MKFSTPVPLQQLLRDHDVEIKGQADAMVTGINEIHKVEPGDITFVDHPKYYRVALHSAASYIIIDKLIIAPDEKTLIVCEKPFHVYNAIAKAKYPFVSLIATVSTSAQIHETAIIEPHAVIGDRVVIGAQCHIQSHSTIRSDSILGDRVNVQSGAIIGTDAFYYKKEDGRFRKWHSCGRVVIGDDVEIGAACTINRGVSGDTIIGSGSKLDSQVHIGHGAVIGKNCLIAAQVGVSGKTVIEDDVTLYGQVGVAQNLRIGRAAVISAKSGVSKSLEGGKAYFGIPASESRRAYSELAALRKLPELIRKWERFFKGDK